MRKAALTLLSALCALSLYAQDQFVGQWSGKLAVGQSSITLVFNISKDDGGQLVCTVDSPDQGAKGIPAEVSVEGGMTLCVNVPSLGASYKGLVMVKTIAGTFSQMGRNFPLTLKYGVEKLNRPQTPVGPFPYSEEEISFTNEKAGATLCGTLVRPQGFGAQTPVVLLVTGSGLQNRDEEIFEHKPFFVIADFLARHGIASLRYDDRSFGKSTGGEVKNATTADFKEDAAAGAECLRAKGFTKIGIIGHSEGASIAFMLGSEGKADFVVSLAGIGVPGAEALTAQVNKVLELQGVEQRYDIQSYRALVRSQQNAWMNWFIDYDPIPDIRACKCPVFALNGEKDIQIISSLNLQSIKENLQSNSLNKVKEYPSLNHLFQHCETGAVNEYRTSEETISPEVLSDLASWTNSLP